jgi:hypothetical protein
MVPQRFLVVRAVVCALLVPGVVGCGPNDQSKNLGGTLTGLKAGLSVTLKNNNNGDVLQLSENGPFHFQIYMGSEAPYTVVVVDQPTGQSCTIQNGTGFMGTSAAPVDNIEVNCV